MSAEEDPRTRGMPACVRCGKRIPRGPGEMETEWSFDEKPPRFYHTLCYMEEYPDAADAFADAALAAVLKTFADLSNFVPDEGEHS